MYQNAEGPPPGGPVGAQADLLMRRLEELDRATGAQQWWLLGRVMPEAHALAEVSSLLAVARAELDQFLVEFFQRPPSLAADAGEVEAADDPLASGDDDQLAAQRATAGQLLRMLGAALPPTTLFARNLRQAAERAGLPAQGVDALGIVAERLSEAQEALHGLLG
jgi:hypothetical protein